MTRKKEILIIEDERDISEMLQKFLEENDFIVSLAEDGNAAVEILKSNDFDLLIVDMLLPGEHGLDIIKMKGHNYITPIIIISGIYDEKEIFKRTKDSNVKYFIKKPFNLKDLLEKVKSAINADQI